MHPVAVHWAKKSNCSAEEWYSASFRLSAYNDSCTALTHNWESLLLNTYKQHIAHFMMWEQEKYWAVLWLIQKHVGIRRNNLSTASAWQRISAVCKKSNHLWIQSVCISLGQEKSQQSKPGFGKNLAPNSQTIIWTIHLDKKKKTQQWCVGHKTQGTWSNWAKQSHRQPDTNLRGFRRKAWRRIPGYHTVASIPMDN